MVDSAYAVCSVYTQVLRAVLATLPGSPLVSSFMVDFETAMWKALAHVFPDLPVKGCVFHLTQAVWRKIQEVGLTTAYMERRRTHKFLR